MSKASRTYKQNCKRQRLSKKQQSLHGYRAWLHDCQKFMKLLDRNRMAIYSDTEFMLHHNFDEEIN